MSNRIHFVGNEEYFIQILRDRLLRAGALFTDEPANSDIVIAVGDGFSGDISIVYGDQEPGSADIIITIHDLLSPDGKLTHWGDSELHDWAKTIMKGDEISPLKRQNYRFWVNIRDVCDALCILIMDDRSRKMKRIINIAGRRAWPSASIIQEMEMLWRRYSNSLNHSHTVKSLSSVPGPAVDVSRERTERPDLSSLHDCLRQCGSEGWHPLVPMRVSLMEIFAHANN